MRPSWPAPTMPTVMSAGSRAGRDCGAPQGSAARDRPRARWRSRGGGWRGWPRRRALRWRRRPLRSRTSRPELPPASARSTAASRVPRAISTAPAPRAPAGGSWRPSCPADAPHRPRRPGAAAGAHVLGAGGLDAPRPLVPVDLRVPARELGERGRPFRDQSLAPGADLPEALGVAAGARIAGSERGADRFEVDLAHEPADILTLAHGGGAAGDAPRRANRIKERFREFERFELGIAERRERLAQILGGVRGALARALARRLCPGLMGVAVVVRHHRLAQLGRELQFKPNAPINHPRCKRSPYPVKSSRSPTWRASRSRRRAARARPSARPTPRSAGGCR